MHFLGSLPYTNDGVQFGMGANLWMKSKEGKAIPVGVISIVDPNDRHFEDYEEGKRYSITVISALDGNEADVHEGDLFTTEQAATAVGF